MYYQIGFKDFSFSIQKEQAPTIAWIDEEKMKK